MAIPASIEARRARLGIIRTTQPAQAPVNLAADIKSAVREVMAELVGQPEETPVSQLEPAPSVKDPTSWLMEGRHSDGTPYSAVVKDHPDGTTTIEQRNPFGDVRTIKLTPQY